MLPAHLPPWPAARRCTGGGAHPPPGCRTRTRPTWLCPPLAPRPSVPPCSAFNEVYLPWLNGADLPAQRLDLEFATLHSYLRLAGGGGMGWAAVRGLMAAYIRAIVAKAVQR